VNSETRLVEVGESSGPTVALSAAVLRSTALTILGTAGIPSQGVLVAAIDQVPEWAAKGAQIEAETAPLAEVGEKVWQRPESGRPRLVVIPRSSARFGRQSRFTAG
jgi:hypothetical protein